MANSNGQIVLDVLQTLDSPATLQSVVCAVARKCGATPDEVHETVKKTLYGGVRHGFVQYSNRKYHVAAEYEDKEGSDGEEEGKNDDIDKKSGEGEPRDSSRRRRRRSRSRRRRSRRRRY